MMLKEFENLTGIYPDIDLYTAIESVYLCSGMDKQNFCRAYAENKDGLAEKIQRQFERSADAEHQKQENEFRILHQKIRDLEELLKAKDKRIDELLGWESYCDSCMTASEYAELKEAGNMITDEHAVSILNREFGFEPSLVTILHSIPLCQKNKSGEIRILKKEDGTNICEQRNPMYCSTDYFYIFFKVCGWEYEAVNGSLYLH